MPKEVENLIEIARIKILAIKAHIIKIAQKEHGILVYLDKDNIQIDEIGINNLVKKYGPRIRFSPGVETYITLKTDEKDEKKVIGDIKELLSSL